MPSPSIDQIEKALRVLFDPGACVELRAFAGNKTLNGYYKDLGRLAADAMQLNQDLQPPAQVYVVLNPVLPALHAKRADAVGYCGKGGATQDLQVVCRRWIVIDCDPRKPDRGISATDAERQAAEQLAGDVFRYLQGLGFPAPVVATSGNGYWLLYRLPDLPNDNNSRCVLRELLQHLAERFDNQAAVVDRSTFSAAQLVKLLGTVARKGSDTQDRPHRLSRLLSVPEQVLPVTWEQLLAVTGAPPAEALPEQQASESSGWDIPALLEQRQLVYTCDTQYVDQHGQPAVRYELEQCPWEPEHSGSAWIIQFASGAVAAGCLGNRCVGKTWQDLKQIWGLPNGEGITAADIVLPVAQLQQTASAPLLIVRSLDVQPETVDWLWQDRLVMGGINLFAGRGGIGKTYMVCDLAARITNRGLTAPNGQPLQHGRVLYSTAEDHIAKVIEPRMQAHGADRNLLEYIKGLPAGTHVHLLDVVQHCDLLDSALRQRSDTVALVLDPVSAFQGGADSNKVAAVRRFTGVLAHLAEAHNIAVIAIHHFSKGRRELAGDAISGSHAYRDSSRSVWLFALDAQDPTRRLMVSDKHNWSASCPPGVAYRIECGVIRYEAEPLDMTPDELMAQGTEQQLDIACAWLIAQLSAGPQPATDLQIAATLESISERTLGRAKKRLGVQSRKEKEHWVWTMPGSQTDQGCQQQGKSA